MKTIFRTPKIGEWYICIITDIPILCKIEHEDCLENNREILVFGSEEK